MIGTGYRPASEYGRSSNYADLLAEDRAARQSKVNDRSDRQDEAQAPAPRLGAVRFTKEQLMGLSKPERELLLRLGLAMNDLSLFNRVWTACYFRQPKSPLALKAQVLQEVSTLLVFLGKLNEACEVFRKYFLQSRVGRD
jgi:hypothetical protein